MNTILLYLGMLVAFILAGCSNRMNFDFEDRTHIPSSFQLRAVHSETDRLYQEFTYTGQGRLSTVLLNAVDRFELHYTADNQFIDGFNHYQCSYDAQGRLVEVAGPELISTRLEYGPNLIQIIQTVRTIVPGPRAVQTDTLSLQFNKNGQVQAATLLPAGLVFDFSFDHNVSPYTNIKTLITPIFLVYPMQDVLVDLVGLYSNRNLLRMVQTSFGQEFGIEATFTLDNTYRFDHYLYDIPTSSESFGSINAQFKYLYQD